MAREYHRPDWSAPRHASRPARAIAFIQNLIHVPSGRNAGEPLRLAPYQVDLIEELLAEGATMGGFSIPAGNAKSTTAAALGLWALCDHDDSPQVVLLAVNSAQAIRTLYMPMRQMIINGPLEGAVQVRRDNTLRGFETPWNLGVAWALPAHDERIQGINPTLALVDEAEFIGLPVLQALTDRLGKRDAQLVLAFGTPGPSTDCVLHHVRALHAAGGRYRFVEHAADPNADIRARSTWESANPGLLAGLLGYDAFEGAIANIDAAENDSTRLVLETRLRRFRLGLWVDGVLDDSWLPAGAYAACPAEARPDEGSSIIVAIDGTYRRSTAVVGADVDTGNVFLIWAREEATDTEVEAVIDEACARWNVTEIVHYPTLRARLMGQLERKGYPLRSWEIGRQAEATATNELWNAIATGRFTHDGSELLAEHFANVAFRDTPQGVVLRRVSVDGRWIDGAMAARMAWASVQELNRLVPSIF